jgi:hypothetical protein
VLCLLYNPLERPDLYQISARCLTAQWSLDEAVYRRAAWSPEKGTLNLRNPSDHTQTISPDVGQSFALPAGLARRFAADSPWKSDSNSKAIVLAAGESHALELKPFEVLTVEAVSVP